MAVESFPPDSETAARLRFAGITWVGLRHLLILGIKNARPVKSGEGLSAFFPLSFAQPGIQQLEYGVFNLRGGIGLGKILFELVPGQRDIAAQLRLFLLGHDAENGVLVEITGLTELFDPLRLENTFFASPERIARFENRMATGYNDSGLPVPGKFPRVPDLAASGLWSTPKELLMIAEAFIGALHGESTSPGQALACSQAEKAFLSHRAGGRTDSVC